MSSDMNNDYSKPPLLIQQQVSSLEQRGMVFLSEQSARRTLSRISYSRLQEYWRTFEVVDDNKHEFKANTHFEDVLSLYYFDEDLRTLLFHYLGQFEVFLRTMFAYSLMKEYQNSLIYRDERIFNKKKTGLRGWSHRKSLHQIDKIFEKRSFVFYHSSKEVDKSPPLSSVVEVMSLGQLTFWYKNLRQDQVLILISQSIGIKSKRQFKSLLHGFLIVRNLCAHHSRLVHRILSVNLVKPSQKSGLFSSWNVDSRKLYNLLTLLAYVMPHIDDNCDLKGDIQHLVHKYGISLRVLGFPSDWESRPVWLD